MDSEFPLKQEVKVTHIQKQQIENYVGISSKLMAVAILMLPLASCAKKEAPQWQMFDQSNVASSRSNINPLPF